jgi:hypothetical protein
MGHTRTARGLVIVALVALGAGCQALSPYRPVAILVCDADTKQPIPEAVVRLSYPFAQNSCWPGDARGRTGADGIVRLGAACLGDARVLVETTAGGYLPEAKLMPAETVRALEPAHFFEAAERRPVTLTLEMLAEQPIPTIELVLPTGYRGLVEADLRVQGDAPGAPGQRSFTCTVPPSGTVQLSVPRLFQRFACPRFTARYADGAPLKDNAQGAEVGFWEVKAEGHRYTFLVGTQDEHARYRPQPREGAGDRPSAGGGKGKGRGRKSRSGDAPASGA